MKELASLGAHVVREDGEFNLTTSPTLDHAVSLTCFLCLCEHSHLGLILFLWMFSLSS